jgi:hypothetical protein
MCSRISVMRAKFEECVAFTLIELLKIEQVLVERHCPFHIVHLDGDVIASTPARS